MLGTYKLSFSKYNSSSGSNARGIINYYEQISHRIFVTNWKTGLVFISVYTDKYDNMSPYIRTVYDIDHWCKYKGRVDSITKSNYSLIGALDKHTTSFSNELFKFNSPQNYWKMYAHFD